MRVIEYQNFQTERALYGSEDVIVKHCTFAGEEDGESAFKESKRIEAQHCDFRLRYPFWHDEDVKINHCTMAETCRAPLWYSQKIQISDTILHGVKALRECIDVALERCDIKSTEFGWSSAQITVKHCTAQGEYFLLRGKDFTFEEVTFSGKYSFQYIENATFQNCNFQTKDAFWHAKNVTVTDTVLAGEYLGWYSENLTLVRCKISGTQPFCYCKNLTLIDCEMTGTDLAFEKSQVQATVLTAVDSIKNPASGKICVPAVGEIIHTDPNASCRILVG